MYQSLAHVQSGALTVVYFLNKKSPFFPNSKCPISDALRDSSLSFSSSFPPFYWPCPLVFPEAVRPIKCSLFFPPRCGVVVQGKSDGYKKNYDGSFLTLALANKASHRPSQQEQKKKKKRNENGHVRVARERERNPTNKDRSSLERERSYS